MEIVCNFSSVTWSSGVEHTAEVKEIKNPSGSSAITKFHRNSEEGTNDPKVRGISFNPIHLGAFPTGMDRMFPNLKCLAIVNCGLKKIRRSDFVGLGKLINIDLSSNDLESLPNDLFMDLPNLQRIRLSDNKIARISSKLMLHLKKSLIRVVLTQNALIDEFFFKDSYGSLESIMLEMDEKCLPPLESHLGRLESLFRSGKCSDLTVRVGEKTFKVHKSFLVAHSTVLEKAIADDMEECQSNIIEIYEFSSEVVESMLLFCYIGKIVSCKENLLELFEAAVTYQMPALRFCWEQYFIMNKNTFNAEEVRDLTIRFSPFKL